eukprot:scaffold79955_cov14-Tisochrysis_lutea.AAC.2
MECAAEKKPRTLLREIMAAETQAARLPLEGSLTAQCASCLQQFSCCNVAAGWSALGIQGVLVFQGG